MSQLEHRRKSVICLSGGMDSCVTAAIASRETEAYAVHFSYGQRTEAREFEAARAVAHRLKLRDFLHLKIDLFRQIGGSALTDTDIAVPDAGPSEAIGEHIPVTYVPFRNAHFLSAAVSWAEVIGATRIYIGAVEQDSSGYPDCRPAYYAAFQQLINTGTRDGNTDEGIQVLTPLIASSKAEIIRLGLERNAPLDLTWSCYREEQNACGTCESCVLRLRAFAAVGVPDPIPYAQHAYLPGTNHEV
ncbi:7-cyano-7-deazaguanine synthase QueC [Acidicapsa ligni]|uniref:7-cyano-7-deazaguanine synthase QueC n=1 Tax=Acidicapsa ligni TaxID=542300 RepID=UPI0021E0E148|nr:7-cyano-7-deazaguanine synthase QueC [Acidicapsa ligni]